MKTALITGASSGFGAEFAKIFAKDGYNLVITARSTDRLEKIKTQIEMEYGVDVFVVTKDLSLPSAPQEIFDFTQQKGVLSAEQQAMIKTSGCVWGCDICSEVCPENKGKENTYIPDFINSYRDFFSPTEHFCDRAYTWRGEKVILRNYEIINK